MIGKEGAVGVFVGEGVLDRNVSQYAGGFVAVNPNLTIDCTPESGNLFNVNACSAQQRATACQTRNLSSPENGITNEACNTAEIVPLLCAETANPFDTLCADSSYDVVRGKLCLDSSYRIPTTNTAPDSTECGDQDNGYVSAYCTTPDGRTDSTNCLTNYCDTSDGRRDSGNCAVAYCTYIDVLNDVCEGDVDGENYLTERQMACMGQDINNPGDPRCQSVIEAVCTKDPFNESASVGEFNCTLTPLYLVGAPSVYLTARRVEIAFCTVNNNENSNHARCKLAGVLAVTNHCTLDPFDVFCSPYATEYQLQRAARVDTCDGTLHERAGVLCENAKPTVCDPRVSSSATPFANICGTEYVNQQTTLIDACDGDSTRMVDACNAIVSGSVDVKGCIADPFQAVCPATPFTNQRDAICESTATSFTAGCLTSNDYTSSVALGAIGAREDLIENCS
ncbi:MAG: hypothetical protein K8953_01545, partial [Proteobacteria bacterium]|nr:hypothetical protein [Pseudomonadota bacterium]